MKDSLSKVAVMVIIRGGLTMVMCWVLSMVQIFWSIRIYQSCGGKVYVEWVWRHKNWTTDLMVCFGGKNRRWLRHPVLLRLVDRASTTSVFYRLHLITLQVFYLGFGGVGEWCVGLEVLLVKAFVCLGSITTCKLVGCNSSSLLGAFNILVSHSVLWRSQEKNVRMGH